MTTTKVQKRGMTKEKPLTAYGAAKIVNQALKDRGVEKRIPPQMMYNYTHARVAEGKQPYIMYTKTGGVDVHDLQRWLTAYLDKLE